MRTACLIAGTGVVYLVLKMARDTVQLAIAGVLPNASVAVFEPFLRLPLPR